MVTIFVLSPSLSFKFCKNSENCVYIDTGTYYWWIPQHFCSGAPVLPENVYLRSLECVSVYNTGMQKWSKIVINLFLLHSVHTDNSIQMTS